MLGTAAAILEFPGAHDLDIVYLEQYRGTHHLVKQAAEVAQFQRHFAELTERCLDQRRSVELMGSVTPGL
ncbi:Scr1 family TA system antitoxin-like transcriptional regulator [Actinoplanes sp. NPDC049596]|uniref:Scr1 family TA system antitoxin-like transcriptional regulator n=1 Tax=unclassified Actinoplanes TaxID=2626549 RepID=UPI003440C8EE